MSELHEFLSHDHARLDALLETSLRQSDNWLDSYEEFRRGLLRHIAIEERVLFPELRLRRGRTALERKLHRDHAALAALLVAPPTSVEIQRIAGILSVHNDLEERSGGLYDMIESFAAGELATLMARVHAVPPVHVASRADTEVLRNAIEQLVREAKDTPSGGVMCAQSPHTLDRK